MQPRFIIMDTCSFLYSLRGENKKYNYTQIREYAHRNNSHIVISPYTLYEIFKSTNTLETIEKTRNQILSFKDFWVQNVNHINDYEGLEYGIDFLFSLSVQNNEDILSFSEKRDQLRDKVSATLFAKIFFLAQLTCIICLYLTNSTNDLVTPDVGWKMQFVDNISAADYSLFEKLFISLFQHTGMRCYDPNKKEFYTDEKIEKLFPQAFLDLIRQILSLADTHYEFYNRSAVSDAEFNEKLVKNNKIYKDSLSYARLRQMASCYAKSKEQQLSINSLFDILTKSFKYPIAKEAFRKMVNKVYSNECGKHFCNDLIDMTNVGLLDHYSLGDAVYITEDENWLRFLSEQDCNNKIHFSNEFIKQFENNAKN